MPDADLSASPTAAGAPPRPVDILTWRQTRTLMRSDFARMPEVALGTASFSQRAFAFVQPNHLGLYLHRIARYFFLRRWYTASMVLSTVSSYLTRIEIPPTTSIGASCRIVHAPVILCGAIGERFTCFGFGGCGGGYGSKDIGAGAGFPIIGDDVVLSITATVHGPVRIGDGVRIGPGATVSTDVPAGAVVAGPLSRISRARGDATTEATS